MDRVEARRVRVLPDDLANQIAAGEVVERPSSVVKELVENALDAEASRVAVEIEGGGVALVRVVDDGFGMSPADAERAVLRHATSKITGMEDLRRIESFGFRGEALPSIASVSRFRLRTRLREADEGTEVLIEGGSAARVAPCGIASGTVIEVRDLFFNVPARRKFLRAQGTESAHVGEVLLAAALGEPAVTFVLSREGRVVREYLRGGDRRARALEVFEGEPLALCEGLRGSVEIEAHLSRPERARAGASGLYLFVNGRPVRDRGLLRAAAQAYGSVLEPGRYPLGVVYVDLPAESVDVNVHPQKAEVRFADGRAVSDAVFSVLSSALARAFGAPAPASRWRPEERKAPASPPERGRAAFSGSGEIAGEGDPWGLGPAAPAAPPAGARGALGPGAFLEALAEATLGGKEQAAAYGATPSPPLPIAERREGQASFGSLRFLAQARLTYLVCEGDDGLYVLDQHAAAERVTFHRLREAYGARAVARQKLLFPVVFSASAEEAALCEEAAEAIGAAGFDVRATGSSAVAVHAVPALLGRASPERLARDLLAELSRAAGRPFSSVVDLAFATMACHGSLRAGDPVPADEARALLAALEEVDFAGHCPHGRPVVSRIAFGELERAVGRR